MSFFKKENNLGKLHNNCAKLSIISVRKGNTFLHKSLIVIMLLVSMSKSYFLSCLTMHLASIKKFKNCNRFFSCLSVIHIDGTK